MNKVIMKGRLTADPELKQTTNGISLVNFTIAVDRQYKNNGEKKADFIRCQAWRQTAEFVQRYFSKGKLILVEGEMQNNDYEKDGVKHYGYVVSVNSVEFCGDSNANKPAVPAQPAANAPATATVSDAGIGKSDDLIVDIAGFEEILNDSDVPF